VKPETPGAERFAALWHRCVVSPPAPDATTVFADLQRRHEAPLRFFHNLDHIRDCIRQVDEVAPLLVDRDAAELALWFHDAVYEPGAANNEQRSAELFLDLAVGAPPSLCRRVCAMILATRHTSLPPGNDRRFVMDIDLAGFGAPWEEFVRRGADLRAEYAGQTDAQYFAGQALFLQRLARRRHFFGTAYFRDRYEATARENLRRLLADLGRRGYTAATR
jgi:predicted metal-dependent HD superfamily phosphohydrolase